MELWREGAVKGAVGKQASLGAGTKEGYAWRLCAHLEESGGLVRS